MSIIGDIRTTIDKTSKLIKGLEFIKESDVLVGIPQKKNKREVGDEVTNSELLFIHTKGSPINNIPARPVIELAIEDDSERLSKMLKDAANSAMDGNEEDAIKKLRLTGMRGQNVSRAWFTNPKNNWPPNAPSVEKAKREKGSTDPKPLIDTGELRKSITYVIEKKGERVE